ncbi:MAG: hypothetical protein Q8O76_15670 [Chloroflexota bacterium]|nr:hypothetical protein [Chloroflexota bacterium]
MSALARAVAKKRWELASLCLLLGMVQAMSQLPPDAVEGLIEALEGPGHGRRQ